jgi:hypothetical protein
VLALEALTGSQCFAEMNIHSEVLTARATSSSPARNGSLARAMLFIVALGAIAGCASAPTSVPIDEPRLASERRHLARIALDSWEDERRRVYVVSHRLLKAADDLGQCHSLRATRGVLLQDLSSLPPGLAAEVEHDGTLSGGLPVIGIDLQAAAQTQLRIGDVVTAIDGKFATSVPSDWDSEHPIEVTVSRNGAPLDFRLQSHRLCDIPVVLDESHDTGASESFGDARVQQGLVQALPDDDSLALVLGHEFGHIVSGDSSLVRIFDRAGSQEQERRADAFGLRLLTAAGYDPHRVQDVWERLARVDPDRVGQSWLKDHPLRAERSLRMKDAISAGDN